MIARNLKIMLLWGAFITMTIIGGGLYMYRAHNTVAVIHPLRGPAVQAVYATGTVEPTMMMPLAPRLSSRLMALYADEEDAISKGAILARLEDSDIRNELAEAQARADLARKEWARHESLIKKGAISVQARDIAQRELNAATAVVEKLQSQLGYMTLIAPEDGIIIRRDGEIGEFITAGQPVFWIAGKDLRISAEVDEEDIALIKPGQEVVISADSFPGTTQHGTVNHITPKGDPIARSYRVRIDLPLSTRLMIGMTAESNIVIRKNEQALLLPASAVHNQMIWVVEGNVVRQRGVVTGAQTDNLAEIVQGVGEDDLVVRAPRSDLKAGARIRARLSRWSLAP